MIVKTVNELKKIIKLTKPSLRINEVVESISVDGLTHFSINGLLTFVLYPGESFSDTLLLVTEKTIPDFDVFHCIELPNSYVYVIFDLDHIEVCRHLCKTIVKKCMLIHYITLVEHERDIY